MSTYLEEYLPTLKRHLAHCKFLKCTLYDYDETQGKVIQIKTLNRKICVIIWNLLTGSYITFQFINFLTDESSFIDKLVAALIAGVNLVCFLYQLEFEVDTKAMENHNRLISGVGEFVLTIPFLAILCTL